MDIVESEGIKVPNSVIVSGLTNTEHDDELIDILKKYGSFARTLTISDKRSEFYQSTIIEYNSGQALQSLEPQLPYNHQLSSDPGITYHVRALSGVFTQQLGNSVTKSYLEGLKEIAKVSGTNFETVLSQMLSQMSAELTPMSTDLEPGDGNPSEQPFLVFHSESCSVTIAKQSQVDEPLSQHTPIKSNAPPLYTSQQVYNPPEVHGEVAAQGPVQARLRVFSGKCPRPGHEVDYDTWRSSVELILKDPGLSDLHVSRKLVDSLLPPAADVIKHLSSEAPSLAYLQLLDSAFGVVEDGDELLARFMNTLQDAGEKPSAYLYRLQTALRMTIKRGGIPPEEADRHLLKQFCRGCWDNDLITELQLEHKRNRPPSFAPLLLMLLTEEDKHTAKVNRMKQHLGSSKQRALMHSQRTWASAEFEEKEVSNMVSLATETQELKKQIAKLQSQLANLATKPKIQKKSTLPEAVDRQDKKRAGTAGTESVTPVNKKSTGRPRPWYCFTCGEDGHVASSCTSEPNPALVTTKRKLLREKQLLWDSQNPILNPDLN
ncbi:putative zinc finger CCHC domain-containing protein 12-like [Triplophysa rosa]|uniref:Zinc finger CCHC domain-containing protein 12-like n=1 Tax=Triplophysa rosa TaxID=992332 RepID=A0A9W7TWL5_TRIRA|nr:putative zinc finger CCHC domain-containing protein 12-like [Triplophysa rosa]